MSEFRFFACAAIAAALSDTFLPAAAVRAAAPDSTAVATLTQDLAESMAQGCLRQSDSKGWPAFTVAVVDSGGALVLLRRADSAAPVTAEVATLKARSAVRTRAPTRMLAKMGEDPPTRDLFLLLQLTDDPGGLPVEINGRLIGGIGVSGGTADQDVGCAAAAAAALTPEKQ